MPTVRIAKGLNLFYRESGSGDRVLLLIHGNVASSVWWERVMALLPAGLKAYAPDLRGCGDSEKPEGAWGMHDLADDIFQFAQAVGIGRATVVGHSLGGAIAQQLAVEHPELVERLLLLNSAEPAGLRVPEATYAQIEAIRNQPEIVKAALGAMAPTAPKDPFLARVLEESAAKSTGAWARNGQALEAMNLVDEVGRLQMPVLLLYGEKDLLVTREMQERMHRQIPTSVLECWPEVGHSANVEDPERFVRRLVAFMGF
ncbi:MAG: alpha/beta fold hydrolase [Bacillota bacterium]